MATLDDAITIGHRERFLAVVSTVRADATIQSSVVNAGVMAHVVTGAQVVGFVTYGRAKLANLRARPQVTVTFRAGGEWVSVEGRAELAGPDDPYPGIDPERLRLLCAKSSRLPAVPTMTGRRTTRSWPSSTAPRSWSHRPASTATEQSGVVR
jgi:PPOX class probable F420-dependent enzyme